jgi:hypothetical protein
MQVLTMKIIRPEDLTSFPEMRELTPDELAEAYALSRASFTAEDLQRFTELDEGTPMEDLLKELEEAQRQFDAGSS